MFFLIIPPCFAKQNPNPLVRRGILPPYNFFYYKSALLLSRFISIVKCLLYGIARFSSPRNTVNA
jgi:hypothetical protein